MHITGFSSELLLLLFLAASTAGFLDTLAGGGGLITLPALFMSGVPPLLVLGTNKLQSSMGTATATYMMVRAERVNWRDAKSLMAFAFLGGMLGAVGVQFIDARRLNFVIPAVLLLVAVYFLLSPRLLEASAEPRLSFGKYQKLVLPLIGCYDGMFGPGTGSFLTLAGVSLRGHSLIDATAVAKTLNFSTNIASLIVFVSAGKVVWAIGVLMMAGQLLGAWIGSHCLFRINPKYLRLIVVIVCSGLLIRYAVATGWFKGAAG